jgi:hypothetical protein
MCKPRNEEKGLGGLRSLVCFLPVLRIRIQIRTIRMFLGLPDPDPLVRGTDPDPAADPDRLRILPFSHKYVERTEIMPAK